jgi:flagellar FliL protein
MNNKASNAEETIKPTDRKKRPRILWAVLLVVLIGLAVFALMQFGYLPWAANEPSGKEPTETSVVYKLYRPLDFTVNLADKDQRRYLKATVTLAYESKALAKELDRRHAQLRDLMIEVLRRQMVDKLMDPDGTANLRSEMMTELNAVLTDGEIRDIYFTDFIIQ